MPKGVGVRVPLLAPNISDLTPKMVRTIADKPYNCGQIADKMKGERWKSGRPIQPWSTQRITDKFLQFVTGNRHKYFLSLNDIRLLWCKVQIRRTRIFKCLVSRKASRPSGPSSLPTAPNSHLFHLPVFPQDEGLECIIFVTGPDFS